MITLGLTGSIGMGKSATAALFREFGIPVYDADAAVHQIYQKGGIAVTPIGKAFPHVISDGAVDRNELRKTVLDNSEALKKLEDIVHPLVAETQIQAREDAERSGAEIMVLDIPLLFETGGDKRVDYTVVVTAPFDIQRERVLSRPGMTEEAFKSILAKQTPDAEKRARADFVINSRIDIDYAREQVRALIEALLRQSKG
ncbi:MAG: dephospho-CoA kinase [Ponticaulis sp.]|nr:dephospho-CoA kinase [Ponticaulis sp.]